MTTQSHPMKRRFILTMGGALGVGAAVLSSSAQVVLTDGNSSVNIDPSSQAGVTDWIVDNGDYLEQQWYWYRVGNTAEASIDTLGLSSITPSGANQATLFYVGNGFNLEITYSLLGGTAGSGAADLAESIEVINTSGGTLDFTLFLYSDFNLGGTPGGDTVSDVSYSPVPFSSPGYNSVTQIDGADLQQTTFGNFPGRAEAEPYGVTLGKLNDGVISTLVHSGADFGPNGPGDMTYAVQWDLTIGPGFSEVLGVDKRLDVVIPEPTTAALSLLGLTLLYQASRRRRNH